MNDVVALAFIGCAERKGWKQGWCRNGAIEHECMEFYVSQFMGERRPEPLPKYAQVV